MAVDPSLERVSLKRNSYSSPGLRPHKSSEDVLQDTKDEDNIKYAGLSKFYLGSGEDDDVDPLSLSHPGAPLLSRPDLDLPTNMKKTLTDPRSLHKRKKSPSLKKPGEGLSAGLQGSSSGRQRSGTGGESSLASDGQLSHDESETADSATAMPSGPVLSMATGSASNGGGSQSDATTDDVDGAHEQSVIDPHRTKAAIDHLQVKIHRTMDQIKAEQNAKEENVNEYLRLSANADRVQSQRIKGIFEKKNQKSTQSIAALQKKLEAYQKRLREVETYGVSGHKQAKEVLKDVGQGLKDVGANIREGLTGFSGGVVDNIRGAKETIVSKPKEFAHLIKNRFGSADNINNIRGLEESQGSTEDSHPGSGTLPSGFKYRSDEEASSATSESCRSGTHSSPRPPTTSVATMNVPTAPSDSGLPRTSYPDLEPLLLQLQDDVRENRHRVTEHTKNFDSIRGQVTSISVLKQTLDEDRYHTERLEEQINDLTELHQHEITNIKQELSSMEEKMEYQLEERTRDMQELLDACQTRISKMEMQQQQQLISMEGIENSNFRALITKLINVVLALLAVILVLVSTIANLLGPFLTTRLRILTTVFLIASIVAVWQNWDLVKDASTHVVDKYQTLVSGR